MHIFMQGHLTFFYNDKYIKEAQVGYTCRMPACPTCQAPAAPVGSNLSIRSCRGTGFLVST